MKKALDNVNDVERATLDINCIYLAIDNPRFHGEGSLALPNDKDNFCPRNQEIIRQHILKKYGAHEIVESIMSVGYICVDMIVVKDVGDNRYIVVEGNRRITAIKTILGNHERKVTTLDDKKVATLRNIEVLKFKDTNSASMKQWIIQGIRHVSGIKSWGPYQQAMLVDNLHKDKMSYREIAKTIGIHHNKVSSMLRAYYLLKQMKSDSTYKCAASANYFSHLEQAYLKIAVRNWLEYDDETMQFENIKNLHVFYNLITTKNEAYKISAKNIRDDFSAIIQHSGMIKLLLEEKVQVQEAISIVNANETRKHAVTLLATAQKNIREILQIKHRSDEINAMLDKIKKEIIKVGI